MAPPVKRSSKGSGGGRSTSKRFKDAVSLQVNPEILAGSTKGDVKSAFAMKKAGRIGTVAEMITEPFNVCVLQNLLADDGAINGLRDELLGIPFNAKNNDLYKFSQSDDLSKFDSPYISGFRKCLQETMVPWLREVTRIPLDGTISLTSSKYVYTDVLLCHDDELEGRRIAFILYLTPGWMLEDGGTLDLFDVDSNGQPRDIIHSLVPRCNGFAFFEVSPVSFHQVAEVLSEDKVRLSVGGWFHGPPIKRPEPYIEPLPERLPCCSVEEQLFRSWINPTYLADSIVVQIQSQFQDDSEIHLDDFLRPDKCKALEEALTGPEVLWSQCGPRNHRWTLEQPTPMPPIVEECLRVFGSEAMFLVLSNLTGLKLHELAEGSSSEDEAGGSQAPDRPTAKSSNGPRCTQAVHKWSHGTYTLAYDHDLRSEECALEAVLYLNCKDWEDEYGGFTTYIAKGVEEEVLTLTPTRNSLALVYRDEGLFRFVKHVNHRVTKRSREDACFHDMSFVYYE